MLPNKIFLPQPNKVNSNKNTISIENIENPASDRTPSISAFNLSFPPTPKSKFFGKYLTPFERLQLENTLQQDLPQKFRQRIEIMLLADAGKNQAEIVKSLQCSQDTVRRWTLMARTGMALHWQETPIGRPKKVNQLYLQRLKELVSHSPKEFGYCFRRWTANWLRKHLAKELNIEVSERYISRLLQQMGLSTKLTKG